MYSVQLYRTAIEFTSMYTLFPLAYVYHVIGSPDKNKEIKKKMVHCKRWDFETEKIWSKERLNDDPTTISKRYCATIALRLHNIATKAVSFPSMGHFSASAI